MDQYPDPSALWNGSSNPNGPYPPGVNGQMPTSQGLGEQQQQQQSLVDPSISDVDAALAQELYNMGCGERPVLSRGFDHPNFAMTSSPADEKPNLDELNEGPQSPHGGHRLQNATPPNEYGAQFNDQPAFNNQFQAQGENGQHQHLAQSVEHAFRDPQYQFQQQNGIHDLQTQPQLGNEYRFPNAYQNNEPGYITHRPAFGPSSSASPASTQAPRRVPIPKAGSAADAALAGPMSREYTVPPRAKPGRKPMKDDDDAADRRREQNRRSQRRFRDKRSKLLAETQTSLQERTGEYRTQHGQMLDLVNENHQLRAEVQRLATRLDYATREIQELRRQLDPSASAARRDTTTDTTVMSRPQTAGIGPTMSEAAPAVATSNHAHSNSNSSNEIDMTNYGRTAGSFRPAGQQTQAQGEAQDQGAQVADSLAMPDTSNMGLPDKEYSCGFCASSATCACRLNDSRAAKDAANGLVQLAGAAQSTLQTSSSPVQQTTPASSQETVMADADEAESPGNGTGIDLDDL